MHVEKYFFDIIKKYIKTENKKICEMCKKCKQKNILDFDVLICLRNLWLALLPQLICYILKKLLGAIGSFLLRKT